MAVSNRFSFSRDDISCCVEHKELYSANDMITTPLSFPRLMIKVSKFCVTRSKYRLISFRKSEIVVVSIALFFVRLYVQIYVHFYTTTSCIPQITVITKVLSPLEIAPRRQKLWPRFGFPFQGFEF